MMGSSSLTTTPLHVMLTTNFTHNKLPTHVIYFTRHDDICDILTFNSNYELLHCELSAHCKRTDYSRRNDDGVDWWTCGKVQPAHHPVSPHHSKKEGPPLLNGHQLIKKVMTPCLNHLYPNHLYFGKEQVVVANLISFNCQRSAKFCRGFHNWARCFYLRNKMKTFGCTSGIKVKKAVGISMTWDISEAIDHRWCERICGQVIKRMLLDDAMSWLNTLGGGYSALGDYFQHHAEAAGRISGCQMKIALEMGNPPTVIRCHLYYALSLMQLGYLRAAKYIVRSQYVAAQSLPVKDTPLVASCQGIWARLRYLYLSKRRTAT